MTINELKIQLESRQDFNFLRDELQKHLQEQTGKNSSGEYEMFLDQVFAIVSQNIQIDGVDFDKLAAESGGEEIDAGLESRLEELQVETDKLLVEVAELRRTCPQQLREQFFAQIDSIEKSTPISINNEGIQLEGLKDAELSYTNLVSELGNLKSLDQSIPQLVEKLERARNFLKDSVNSEKANEQAVENDDQFINRQRRIARQQDLAAKLLAQK